MSARSPLRRRRDRASVAALVATVALLTSGVGLGAGWLLAGQDDVPEPHPRLAADLHRAADAARAAAGLAPTAWDDGLARAARQHAAQLAARGVLDHAGATAATRTVADRLARAGSPYAHHGENLAYVRGASDPVSHTVDGWLGSPGHRANLLHADFDRVGFGTAIDAAGGFVFVQVLAAAPWSPVAWSAVPAHTYDRRLTLDVRADVPSPVAGLLEVDGIAERVTWSGGDQRLVRTLSGEGPVAIRLALRTGAATPYVLDEAGSIDVFSAWRPAAAHRRWLEVTGVAVHSVGQERIHVTIATDAGSRPLALLVDDRHQPDAVRDAGSFETWLALERGASVHVALAEIGVPGQLIVRHVARLTRSGDRIVWEARP
jgi:hypothetical protein